MKHESIDAAITLLVWDAHEAISRLLESLQSGVAESSTWRLFILDQGSEHETAQLLRAFADRQPDRVLLRRINANIGYPAGHNLLHRLAAARCDSRYLVTLNSDLIFHDHAWLDRLVDFMDRSADIGIAGPTGVICQREPSHRIGWGRVCTEQECAAGQFDSISGSVCIIRQKMISRIGLFDEIFTPGYFEDTDLAFRAKSLGWRIALCPLDHSHHDLGPEKSTAQIKHAELRARYGNFQKTNRDEFVARWMNPAAPRINPLNLREHFPDLYLPKKRELVTC